jgi:hypothetical protein
MTKLLAIVALIATAALGADISGTWKGSADTPNGPIERTFVFKTDGSKLTGETTSQMMGKSEIKDGKVEGDSVTFWITIKFQDNEMKVNYKGKVEGEKINFHVEAQEGGFTVDYVAKKVS